MTLVGLLVATVLSAPSTVNTAVEGAAVRSASLSGMAVIPAGRHERLHGAAESAGVTVGRFAIDRTPVTRREYLEFVRANPSWRKGAVSGGLARKSYLADWQSELDAGKGRLEAPVTSVSWHAAAAYCKSIDKRLPTVDEWEYVAAASESKANATRDRSFINRLVALYTARSASSQKPVGKGFRNFYGVRDMHDRAWEWTADFKPDPQHDPHHDHASMKEHEHTMSCASAAVGAPDPSNFPAFMRSAIRAGLDRRSTMSTLGFRCAATIS
jgi:formylglycine-generating enzyme required for sulfatase activity